MIVAHNDGETPSSEPCPTCGRTDEPRRSFDPGKSALLDLVVIVEDDLRQLKRALEEVAL
jgi:hypothetical protein